MYRLGSDLESRCALIAVVMLLLIGGCASKAGNKTGHGAAAASVDTDSGRAPHEAPARPAVVKVKADVGFTVTEVVLITGDGRADYRQAVSLLAQDNYERG